MRAILTSGMGEYCLQKVSEPGKPVTGVLLLFPHEDEEVLQILRDHGHEAMAKQIEKYWKELETWEK